MGELSLYAALNPELVCELFVGIVVVNQVHVDAAEVLTGIRVCRGGVVRGCECVYSTGC